ncbi:MAG TPA: response regulator transcription factor [Candidatus Limnocylindrales bacterium]
MNPASPSGDIRLAIVDDHPVIARAIESAILEPDERPIRVVGVARTPEDGVELVTRGGPNGPEVVLCDVQLRSGTDGLQVVEAATAAGCRAIVLTSFDRSSLMRAAFERGAAGFLDKGAEMATILAAVRTVAGGGTAFSAAVLDAARFGPRPPSDREIAVLTELHKGATSDEIGARLGISARTVESHLRRLFDRYGVLSRTELAVLALREGWIDAGRG